MDLENVYVKMPRSLRHLAINVEGWRINRSRYNRGFWNTLLEVERRIRYSEADLKAYRDRRLNAFVKHSAETVPYYRRKFNELGIAPDSIRTVEDLACLPIVSKSEVKQHIQSMRSEAVSDRDCIMAHTSGTTGAGLRFATTIEANHELWAVWWRSRRWHGLQPRTWCGYFGGRPVVPSSLKLPPFWLYNYPGRQILFSTYHLNIDTVKSYVEELGQSQPPWLHGYPSALALLGHLMLETGVVLDYQVSWITVSSETLLPQQIEVIKKAFGISPIQDYGLTEAVACASECEMGNLHVDEDFAAVEFIPDQVSGAYRIVGTNFSNFATPFLRYDTGDLVFLSDTDCACGRPGGLISHIDGRQEDYIILSNGMWVGRMDHIFKDMTGVREAQIYQKVPGEIVLRISRSGSYSPFDEKKLNGEIKKRFGKELKASVKYVEKLPRSKNGKLRFVVSDIHEGNLLERINLKS